MLSLCVTPEWRKVHREYSWCCLNDQEWTGINEGVFSPPKYMINMKILFCWRNPRLIHLNKLLLWKNNEITWNWNCSGKSQLYSCHKLLYTNVKSWGKSLIRKDHQGSEKTMWLASPLLPACSCVKGQMGLCVPLRFHKEICLCIM